LSCDTDTWAEEDEGDNVFLDLPLEEEHEGMTVKFDDDSQLTLAQRYRNTMNRRNGNRGVFFNLFLVWYWKLKKEE
jgi:hypothetical protein